MRDADESRAAGSAHKSAKHHAGNQRQKRRQTAIHEGHPESEAASPGTAPGKLMGTCRILKAAW